MQNFLDFEKPLLEIRSKIEELRHLRDTSDNIANELTNLQEKFDKTLDELYDNLTPIQKVKVCRHQDRPKFDEIVKKISNGKLKKFIKIRKIRFIGMSNETHNGLSKYNE